MHDFADTTTTPDNRRPTVRSRTRRRPARAATAGETTVRPEDITEFRQILAAAEPDDDTLRCGGTVTVTSTWHLVQPEHQTYRCWC